MNIQTYIFIGRSGCGKGTQAKLLEEYLKTVDRERGVFYLQTGLEFREFIKGDTYTQKLAKEIYDKGGLQPEFLSIHMWANALSKGYRENEHLIIDGTPRKFHEAGALHSILDFYKLGRPHVIYLNVSENWSVEHMMSRNRLDDKPGEIRARLSWFETDVVPAIGFYRNNPNYHFIEIDGERAIEEVKKDILKNVGLV